MSARSAAGLAQSVEQPPCKRQVGGSIPLPGTILTLRRANHPKNAALQTTFVVALGFDFDHDAAALSATCSITVLLCKLTPAGGSSQTAKFFFLGEMGRDITDLIERIR